jgi:UDP-N-acetylglucosamine:LPS N-acetylglucosamine transferase
VLSGPEPQRTLLENIILQQLQTSSRKTLLICGNPKGTSIAISNPKVQIVNYLAKKELELALLQSHCIVCRSGYSSIMDLIKLNKHAVLIPTPGQTEQEYLAKYLGEKKWFQSSNQNNLNLDMEFDKFQSTQFDSFPSWNMLQYKEIMDDFINSMHT